MHPYKNTGRIIGRNNEVIITAIPMTNAATKNESAPMILATSEATKKLGSIPISQANTL
jgi:hypothetical protein